MNRMSVFQLSAFQGVIFADESDRSLVASDGFFHDNLDNSEALHLQLALLVPNYYARIAQNNDCPSQVPLLILEAPKSTRPTCIRLTAKSANAHFW